MPASLIFRHAPPPLLPLFARAFRRRPKVDPDTLTLPALEARLLGTASVTPALAKYRSLCGFPGGSQLPATWPHILAFPLHLRLLTDTTFPLPLLGLVHLRNRIVQHRAIAEGEALDIRVYLGNWVRSHRGIEFDLVTDVMVAGRTVWQETSTNLYRQAKPEATESRGQTQPGDLPRYPNSLEVRADAALGRRYGAVSGDRNPIHLHPVTARLFGFPRAIAHGMWSQAHCLALLQQQPEWRGGPFAVACQFKKPLLLPGTAQLNWKTDTSGWAFQLLNRQGDAPHLSGRIDWL